MSGLEILPLQEAAELLTSFCYETLEGRGYVISDANMSISKIVEVVNYAARDLRRISHDLNDSVSREKFAAYHAFWFAKLKPISHIVRKGDGQEITDINERLAILLAVEWVRIGGIGVKEENKAKFKKEIASVVGFESPPSPLVWRNCPLSCSGQCFDNAIEDYLTFHEEQNFEYLTHSLRHRAVGPYGMVNFLESIVITSCKSVSDRSHPNIRRPT